MNNPTDTEGAASASVPARPTLRIVRGSPSREEVAVLTAVMASTSGSEEAPERVRSLWADPAHLLRKPVRSGTGAWAASGRR